MIFAFRSDSFVAKLTGQNSEWDSHWTHWAVSVFVYQKQLCATFPLLINAIGACNWQHCM
jgi:hypothetical protein